MGSSKENIKNFLGQIPLTAEVYWLLRQRGKPISRFSLKHLQAELPGLVKTAKNFRAGAEPGKKVFIFATLHYWIEHAALVGVALAARGHQVTLGYLPYSEWQNPINLFDLRRNNAYAKKVLSPAEEVMRVISLLQVKPDFRPMPDTLHSIVEKVTQYDSQYTMQVEEVDPAEEIYQLRWQRNEAVARVGYNLFHANRPAVVIVPNGSIQELGVIYRLARAMKIPVTTYEFGDQRDRIWLAQDGEVMRQETDGLWRACQDQPLSEHEITEVKELFRARQNGRVWQNFLRLWQDTPSSGGVAARAALKLDERPVVLLATNVLGDSLTLGRQVFTHTMSQWISRTVQYFAGRPDTQLVIRIHPGEVLTHGVSMMDVVHNVLPKLPENIHLIRPKDKVNTYDIVEIADLGLVYTTTVGLEMALGGLPVIVAGQTHYRGRGFTYDPDSWVAYLKQLGTILEDPAAHRLNPTQLEHAWRYAYRFFFSYPLPFPWHLVRCWEDYQEHPLDEVLSEQGWAKYGRTFDYLVGELIDWGCELARPVGG
jgi:hypothetical protein